MLWKSYVVKNAYHTISVNLNSFRGLTDFAVAEKGEPMSSKSKRKPKSFSMHKAVFVAMTIFVWAWMECFHPSQDDVNKLSAEVANIRESVGNGNLNVWMVRDAIKDEFGWSI